MTDRLQALLDSAYAANKLERDRLSLEIFLVGLQQEALDFDEALLKQTQLAIFTSFLDFFDSVSSTQDAFSTSRATQTVTATDSHAAQTDAATISLWDILPKARDQAYNRGVSDGKEQGRMQGIEHGKDIGMDESLAVRFNQSHGEKFAKGLAQKDVEIARSLEVNKKAEHSGEPSRGLKQEREEVKRIGHNFSNSALKKGAIHEKNALGLTQELPKSKHGKENIKPASPSYDPFTPIWQDAFKKKV